MFFQIQVNVDVEGGDSFIVNIEYPWKPQRRAACNELGHHIKFCKNSTKMWVAKKPSNRQ